MSAIVSMKWLLARMYESDIAIVDCRFMMGSAPNAGREAYQAGHIPGAVYLDVDQDLSGPVREHGGRHPMPEWTDFAMRLGRAGIGNDVRIVIYDDQGGAMASRLWWMLRYVGHDRVYVMDEGFSAWQREGYPVTDEQRVVIPKQFSVQLRPEMLVTMEEVRSKLQKPGVTLIDSRDPARYRGEVEPLDPKAGHIPGAINRLWSEGRNADGTWKDEDGQAARFADLPRDGEIIVYCGSGITATPNVLALERAGFTNVKLYGGSWSDWISYKGNPIATGDEEKPKDV